MNTFGAIVAEEGDYYLVDNGDYYYDEDGNIEYEEYYAYESAENDDDDDEVSEEEEKDAMDGFIDEDTDEEWVVTNEMTDEYDMYWDDAEKWDEMSTCLTLNSRTVK